MNDYLVVLRAETGPEVIEGDCSLRTLQRLVDGFIEIVPAVINGRDFLMVVDDEGKLKRKELNFHATYLYDTYDIIVGDAVIVMQDGEDLRPLTKEETDAVMARYDPLRVGRWFTNGV